MSGDIPRRRLVAALLGLAAAPGLVVSPGRAAAQSFAGLGETADDGYARPRRDRVLRFPDDHGPHPDFRIEWWYVTANLTGDDGAAYGIQWTLFRQAMAPGPQRSGFASQQFWLAHAGLSTKDRHFAAEKLARGGVGQAGAKAAPFAAWIDQWRFEAQAGAPGMVDTLLEANGADFGYALNLTLPPGTPMVLQGDRGYSVKSPKGQASHYYSQPFFRASGALTVENRAIPVTGRAWMDREWSSQPLAGDQSGWDWFSLHLERGEKLMLFRLRSVTDVPFFAGNWIGAGGESQPLPSDAIGLTPLAETHVAGRQVPTRWRIDIPSRGLSVETTPLNPESWMDLSIGYWEGPLRFSGSQSGVGYLEMTGY